MKIWHRTPDARCRITREAAEWWLNLEIGSWPIAAGQTIYGEVRYQSKKNSHIECAEFHPVWQHNQGANSYWRVALGPFQVGDTVEYSIYGRDPSGRTSPQNFRVQIGPKIFVALLWHQHQPLYRDLLAKKAYPEFVMPWVRLHGLRDYYSMAALVAKYPEVHVTINLTPVLLEQIEDYVEGSTDRALDLTRTPSSYLSPHEREEIARTFFDADWHHEIYPHPRYKELLEKRARRDTLTDTDITDLRMWFNLAWFAPEFQVGEVALPNGERVSVHSLVEKGASYTEAEIEQMVGEQFKILRNIVAIHRQLQESGQIEVATTPFFHPILPLLNNTDDAILDRDGTTLPSRFRFPEDAAAQVSEAVILYERLFGLRPRGMWPAEGAVGESVIPHFSAEGVGWIASDEGVLRRSGRWGYEASRSDVLCQAWRVGGESDQSSVSIFFRDAHLSDAIGFRYGILGAEEAAADFLAQLKQRHLPSDDEDRIVSVILDGENAWGSYEQAGRPFFDALYRALSADDAVCTVTFGEFIEGNANRGVPPHPLHAQSLLHELANASWIDEWGSRPGNDLGTWIGEAEENLAWDHLREAREAFSRAGVTRQSHPQAFEALGAAEGSDWFWWYGDDQTCEPEQLFDALFRQHLRAAYERAELQVPSNLQPRPAPDIATWTPVNQIGTIPGHFRLRVQTGCPSSLTWSADGWQESHEVALTPSGGVMAGLNVCSATIGPFDATAGAVEFFLKCGCAAKCRCQPDDLCCDQRRYTVQILQKRDNTSPQNAKATSAEL